MSSQALLVYHSRRGALEEILSRVAARLDGSWQTAAVSEAQWPSNPPELLVLAGSMQAGRLHPRLLHWAESHKDHLRGVPLALITCGLMTVEQALTQAESAWGQELWGAAGNRHLLLPGFLNPRHVSGRASCLSCRTSARPTRGNRP